MVKSLTQPYRRFFLTKNLLMRYIVKLTNLTFAPYKGQCEKSFLFYQIPVSKKLTILTFSKTDTYIVFLILQLSPQTNEKLNTSLSFTTSMECMQRIHIYVMLSIIQKED